MCPDSLCLEFAGNYGALRQALATTRNSLHKREFDPDLCATAELVLAEVMNNVVEHALAGRTEGILQLTLTFDPPDLTCVLTDNGAEMPGCILPRGAPAVIGTSADDLPEGGFGWHLIRSIAQDLRYERLPGRNRLSFRLSPDAEDSEP